MSELVEMKIGSRLIGPGHPVFVVAEIGATHHGRLDYALTLIELAKRCGAHAVKLQTVDPDWSYVKGTASYEIFTSLKLPKEHLVKMKQAADQLGLILFTTPGDWPSLELALELDFQLMKISSGLMTNSPLVEAVAKTGRPLIVSSGMAYLDEIGRTVRIARDAGCTNIAALHCTSVYPAPDRILNLRAIGLMSDSLQIPVGYSDHTNDSFACTIAVAAGACLLEKHLAISKELAGPEAGTACDPDEFKAAVDQVNRATAMLGRRIKAPMPEEQEGRKLFRRSIIARHAIPAGKRIEKDDIGLMRGTIDHVGLPPELYFEIIGRRATRAIAANEPIRMDCVGEN